MRAADVDVLALSNEDLILHLCMHFTYQHKLRAGLKYLYDLAEVIKKRANQIDWHELIQTAKDWNAERVIWLTFQLLKRITGVDTPPVIELELMPNLIEPETLNKAMRQIFTLEQDSGILTPDLAELAQSKGIYSKFKLIFQRIFISKKAMARLYHLNPNSLCLYAYYLRRTMDLIKDYRKTVWKFSYIGGTIWDSVAH